MRSHFAITAVALALGLTACGGGASTPSRTSSAGTATIVDAPQTSVASPVPSSGGLDEVALTLDDLPAGSTVIAPFACSGTGEPPAAGSVDPIRVCRIQFRLPDNTAVSYGSYLFIDDNSARIIAPLVVGGAAKSLKGIASVGVSPEGLGATVAQSVLPVGEALQFTEILSFARGRVVLFVSVVGFQDPQEVASNVANKSSAKIRGHFGA